MLQRRGVSIQRAQSARHSTAANLARPCAPPPSRYPRDSAFFIGYDRTARWEWRFGPDTVQTSKRTAKTPRVPEAHGDWLQRALSQPGRIIALVIIVQVLIYSISWGQFFCGDSLYYLSRLTRTWAAIARNFVREDDVGQYRPLTYPVFTYLIYPIGRLEPIVYHWIGVAIHTGVSLLVYFLLRRVMNPGAALLGYLVFALHTTGYFITYDMTFLPDWHLAVLMLLILHCWLSYRSTGRRVFYGIALGLFVLALLSKETSLMIPGALFALAMWQGEGEWHKRARNTLLSLWPFFALSVAHFIWVILAKGRLYPDDPQHPFHMTLNPAILVRKLKFIPWILNIDMHQPRTSVDTVYYLLAAVQFLLLTLLLVRVYRLGEGRHRAAWLFAWALVLLLPALLISEPPYEHHLYMPLVALERRSRALFPFRSPKPSAAGLVPAKRQPLDRRPRPEPCPDRFHNGPL